MMIDSTTTIMKRNFKKRSMVALADSADDKPFERLVAPHRLERYQIWTCMLVDRWPLRREADLPQWLQIFDNLQAEDVGESR